MNVGTGGGGELGDMRSLPLKSLMNPLFFFTTCFVGPLTGESPGNGMGGTYLWGESKVFLPFPPALLDRARP